MMPLIYQFRIYRTDLQANPNVLYVFGDNVQRIGLGGQAKEMRGEPNAVGIATKFAPQMDEDAFFTDDRFQEQVDIIKQDAVPVINHLKLGGLVVWPLDGIGSGLSEVPQRSPKTWRYLEALRSHLEGM